MSADSIQRSVFNQLQFNLAFPPNTKNIESISKKPSVITVQKFKQSNDNAAIESNESVQSISNKSSPVFSSIDEDRLKTAVTLAKRDMKNKKLLDFVKELGIATEKPNPEIKEKLKPNKEKKTVKIGNKTVTGKTRSINNSRDGRIGQQNTRTHIPSAAMRRDGTNRNVNTNSVDISRVEVRPHSPPTRDTEDSHDMAGLTREEALVSDLARSHYQLHQQLETIRSALKSLTHKISINVSPPKHQGSSLFIMDKDEDIIRRRVRMNEQTTRSTRTIYFLRRQIHDIERDFNLRRGHKTWVTPEKSKALTRTIAVFRGANRCIESRLTSIKDIVPSDGTSVDLTDVLSLLKQLIQLRPHMDDTDSCLKAVDESSLLVDVLACLTDNMQQKIDAKFSSKKKKNSKSTKQGTVKKNIRSKSVNTVMERLYSDLKKDVIKQAKSDSTRERASRYRSSLATAVPYLAHQSTHSMPTTTTSKNNKVRSRSKSGPKPCKSRSRSREKQVPESPHTISRTSSVTAPTLSSIRRCTSAPPGQVPSKLPWRPSGAAVMKPVITTEALDRSHCRSQSLIDLTHNPHEQGDQAPTQSILKKPSKSELSSPQRPRHDPQTSPQRPRHDPLKHNQDMSREEDVLFDKIIADMYGVDPSQQRGGGYGTDVRVDPSLQRGGGYGTDVRVDPSLQRGGGYGPDVRVDPSLQRGGGYGTDVRVDPSLQRGDGGGCGIDVRYALMDHPELTAMLQRLDEMQEEEDKIRSKWSSVSFHAPSHKFNSTKDFTPREPAPVSLDNLYCSLPQITAPARPDPILFTHHRRTYPTPELPHTSNGTLPLPLSRDSADSIRKYVQVYKQYLRRSSHHTAGVFDPWTLIQNVCDDIVGDCIAEVTNEIERLSGDLVDHVCTSEFTVPSQHPQPV